MSRNLGVKRHPNRHLLCFEGLRGYPQNGHEKRSYPKPACGAIRLLRRGKIDFVVGIGAQRLSYCARARPPDR